MRGAVAITGAGAVTSRDVALAVLPERSRDRAMGSLRAPILGRDPELELLEGAKNKAKASGLWNFFLPHSEIGRGLTNLDYAYIAAELGKHPLSSESLNCSAPT